MEKNEKEELFGSIIQTINKEISGLEPIVTADLYRIVVNQLSTIPYFNWTGIYLLDKDKNELILDYYVGKPTEHTHIPVGRGVCGSAVAEKTDKIVEDVTSQNNYLACSMETRSEIVVLIKDKNDIIGQIDVDSDEVGAFDETDQKYLRIVSGIITKNLKSL